MAYQVVTVVTVAASRRARRSAGWIVFALFLLMAMTVTIFIPGVVVSTGVTDRVIQANVDDCATDQVSYVGPGPYTLSPEGLTVKGGAMDVKQAKIAVKAANIIASRSDDFPTPQLRKHATVTNLSAGIVESQLRNLKKGDRDSRGYLQQRPSQGWGTRKQVRNVRYATNAFLNAMLRVDGWQDLPTGFLAQEIQRSGFPERYVQYTPEAEAIYARLQPAAGVVLAASASQGCDKTQKLLEQIVQAALSHVGQGYSWDDEPEGAGFTSSAFRSAGIDIPSELTEYLDYTGDEAAGVAVTRVPLSEIGSLTRGDVIVNGSRAPPGGDPTLRSMGVYIGNSTGEMPVGTLNVHGSSHTAATGEKSGPSRVVDAAGVIKREGLAVVGLQELQRNQRGPLMDALGEGWAIWPDKATYRDFKHNKRANSQNSIVYDTSQVTLVRGDSMPLPYYFRGRSMPRDVPLALFEHNFSSKKFWVANTHHPAYARHAELRKIDAEKNAEVMDDLVAKGFPVYFTGDFNSGYKKKKGKKGNITYRKKRKYLTWCILTASGNMVDGYDAARSRTGCSRKTSSEMKGVGYIDHVFVDADQDVTGFTVIDKAEVKSDHPLIYVTTRMVPNQAAITSQPGSYGKFVGPRASDGKIVIQPVRQDEFLYAYRFRFFTPPSTDLVAYADGAWVFPLPAGSYRSTGRYGMRTHPIYHTPDFHNGDDWAAPYGTPIRAMHDGVVSDIGINAGAWGNYLRIDYPGKIDSCYAHLSTFKAGLSEDQKVVAGETVGYVGSTGASSGPHLHLTMCTSDEWIRGNAVGTVDPQKFLDEVGVKP